MLCMGGRSLAGGCCAGRKASSTVCCGVVLVLVPPGLDPAYGPAVAAQEALSTRCSQALLPLRPRERPVAPGAPQGHPARREHSTVVAPFVLRPNLHARCPASAAPRDGPAPGPDCCIFAFSPRHSGRLWVTSSGDGWARATTRVTRPAHPTPLARCRAIRSGTCTHLLMDTVRSLNNSGEHQTTADVERLGSGKPRSSHLSATSPKQ